MKEWLKYVLGIGKQPVPGEFYEFVYPDKSCPFPSKYPPCKVLEVKDGWVRFDVEESMGMHDERMKVWIFLGTHRKVGV